MELDPYQFLPPAERWNTVLDRLAYAHFGFFCVVFSATDYCLGSNAEGDPVYGWTQPAPESQRRLEGLLAILDFAQAHSIQVYWGEWSPAHTLGIHTPSNPRWARIVADFLQYLMRTRHYTATACA